MDLTLQIDFCRIFIKTVCADLVYLRAYFLSKCHYSTAFYCAVFLRCISLVFHMRKKVMRRWKDAASIADAALQFQ